MRKCVVASALALGTLIASAAAQVSSSAPGEVDPHTVDTLAQETVRQQKTPALTLAINGVSATPASGMRMASIAKPMTAIAAMQLARHRKARPQRSRPAILSRISCHDFSRRQALACYHARAAVASCRSPLVQRCR